jgi:hypothetical protein
MEFRDMKRWFIMGWAFFVGMIALFAVLVRIPSLGIVGAHDTISDIIVNPQNFANLFTIGFAAFMIFFIAYPIVVGYLIEEIDRRVRIK